MKKSKKLLVTASLVSTAMVVGGCRFLPWANSNASVYGPPPEEYDPRWNMEQPEYGVPYYEPYVTPEPPAATERDWYKLTKGHYAVIRIVSVPKETQEGDGTETDALCGIEVLSFYDAEGEDLSGISMLAVPQEDLSLFSEGDVLFVEPGSKVIEGDNVWWRLKYAGEVPVYTPFIDNRLDITPEFERLELYDWFWDYGAMIEWNQKEAEAGREAEFQHESPYFEDGVTTEDVAVIFECLKLAKEQYEGITETEQEE